jgi:hypothetical protein
MKSFTTYIIPLFFITRGLLVSYGFDIPRAISDTGKEDIAFGLILILFIFFLEYLGNKYNEEKITDNIKKTFTDYLCVILSLFATSYFGMYIFGFYKNDILFVLFITLIIFCGEKARKFL